MPHSYRQAEKRLLAAGFNLTRAGDHRIFTHPLGARVALGFHGSNQALRKNEERELRAGLAMVERSTTEPGQ